MNNLLIVQIRESVNSNYLGTFMSFDKKLACRILWQNFALLEEQSKQFHAAIKDILEQIVFHRESLGVVEREVFAPRIRNFQERMDEFNQEYKRMLRDPSQKRRLL